jgi:hypothetical protein
MRALVGLVVVAVCLAPVTATAASGTANADVTITVSVTDADGNPVGGANVTVAYDDTTKHAETFSNGEALFDVPEGADVSVSATDEDLALNHPVTASDVDGETEITLEMYQQSTAVVTIESPAGGPIGDATVRMEKADESLPAVRATTAANGTIVAPGLEAGEYDVRVTRAGYYTTEATMTVENRSTRTITIEPGSVAVTFETVDGHYADPPALPATVVVYDGEDRVANFSTGSSGTRTVSLDVNTRYRIEVSKSGYDGRLFLLRTTERDVSETFAINRTPALSIDPANTKVVTGQSVRVSVTDEYDEAVEGASIQVNGDTVTETDANGEALVEIDASGDVEITAVKGALETSVTIEGVSPDGEDTATATQAPATTAPATTAPAGTTAPETTAATDPPAGTTTSTDGMPGFGAGLAVLAVATALVALVARDRV